MPPMSNRVNTEYICVFLVPFLMASISEHQRLNRNVRVSLFFLVPYTRRLSVSLSKSRFVAKPTEAGIHKYSDTVISFTKLLRLLIWLTNEKLRAN